MIRQRELLERELSERRRIRRIQMRSLRKEPPCQQDDNSRGGKRTRCLLPELPEEIWCHIHSLMQLRDAARVACLSHTFLRSWRCHPNLLFNWRNIGSNSNGWDFTHKIDHILKNHSGIGVKTLKLELIGSCNAKTTCLDRWLEIAITPGIEELTLDTQREEEYNFPCSLLFDRRGSSIWYLRLVNCAFRPTVELCCLRSLTMLHLCDVRITGDELGYLLFGCVALQRLEIQGCPEITCVKIPLLQQLSHVQISYCQSLRMIKNEAPNIHSFELRGNKLKHSHLGKSLQLRNLDMQRSRVIYYAREELPSSAPNLETLKMVSFHEKVKVLPKANSKFLHLKYLDISLYGRYDYLYLASFLDASPSLETLILRVPFIPPQRIKDESVFEDPSNLRKLPDEYRHHDKLRTVKIARFYATKNLVELACHVLENATLLECLTLDTTNCAYRCSSSIYGKCSGISDPMEASKAVLAIRTYIEPKTPPAVNLDVVGPCRRCHSVY